MRVCGGVVNTDAIDEVGVEFVERSKWMLVLNEEMRRFMGAWL